MSLTPYELQRLETIARNQRVLDEMGIASAWEGGAPKAHQNKIQTRSPKKTSAPKDGKMSTRLVTNSRRKSARLEGKPANMDTYVPRKLTVKQREIIKLRAVDSDTLYKHNLMRTLTMSDLAMRRRIARITNLDKMDSLLQVLCSCKKFDLLREAQAARNLLLPEEQRKPLKPQKQGVF